MIAALSNFLGLNPRIYFLVENRENAEDPSFETNLKAQRLYNEKIIQTMYRPGDVILVEDDAAKDAKLVRKEQLPSFDAHKFNVRGWYSPVACEMGNDLSKSIDNIQTKLDAALMPFCLLTVEKRIEAYKILHDYASEFPLPECLQEHGPLISKEDLIKLAKDETYNEARDILFKCCELFIEQSKLKHFAETYSLQQESLKKVTVEAIQEGANRVFVIIGKYFQEPTLAKKFPYSCKVVNEKNTFDECLKTVKDFFCTLSGCDVR